MVHPLPGLLVLAVIIILDFEEYWEAIVRIPINQPLY